MVRFVSSSPLSRREERDSVGRGFAPLSPPIHAPIGWAFNLQRIFNASSPQYGFDNPAAKVLNYPMLARSVTSWPSNPSS